MVDFNKIKFKGKDDNFNKLKGGVKRESIKDSTLLNIFDKVDSDGNKILDSKEINIFQQRVQKEAEHGKDSMLSKNEAGKYLESIGVQADNTQLFKFLNTLSNESSNIKSSNVLENGSIQTEYNDGSIETISNDGSTKEIKKGTTTQKFVLKADGEYELTEEIFIDPKDGSEVLTKFKDGKKTSSVKTYVDNSTETIAYDESGKEKSKEISKDGGKTIETYEYENGNAILKSKIENKGTPNEKTTTYEQENSGTTETVIENGKETIIKKDNNGTVITTINDGKNIITTVDDGNNQTKTVTDASGKKLSETKTVDGKEYSVEYDGNGNTKGITVENGESPAVIAKKFGCKVEDLINANKDSIQGKAPNQYFLVGTDIVIPGEIDADKFTELTSGRQSKEDAVKQYAAEQKVRDSEDKEVEDRKDNKKTFIEQKYNTFKELAIGLFKRERVENPTARQIELRVKELKALNPDLKDGELIGKKVIATFNNETAESIGAGQKSREDNRSKAQGKSIANDLYNDIDGIGTRKTFGGNIQRINENNVVSVIQNYQNLSNDESISEAILDEINLGGEERIDAVKHIFDKLIKKAESLGIDTKQAKTEFNKAMNNMSSFMNNETFDPIFNSLVSAINGKSALTKEERTELKNAKPEELQQNTVNYLNDTVNGAEEALNEQLKKDGWTADLWEGLKWMGGSDNLDEKVKADISEYKSQLQRLDAAKKGELKDNNGNTITFEQEFENIFGVKYDPALIKAHQKRQAEYVNYASAKTVENTFNNQFKKLISSDKLTQETQYQQTSSFGTGTYSITATKDEVYQRELKKVKDFFGGDENFNQALKDNNITLGDNIDENYKNLSTMMKKMSSSLRKEVDKTTNGLGDAAYEKEYENSYKSAFGLKNDIAKRVSDYNTSQQVGGEVVKGVVKAGAAIGLALIPGVGLVATAVGTTVISAAVDTSDRISSEEGLKDGEITTILKNAVIDGASVFAGGQVGKYAMMFKSANAFTQAGGRLVMQAAGDVATGTAAEYLQTGTITLEGVAFQAVFSAAGNLVNLKQLAKTDIPEPRANILDKATNNAEHIPGGKLGKDKFKQAKAEIEAELPDADPARAAQIYNEADQLQAQSRAQGREIKHIVEDNIGDAERGLINKTTAQKTDNILSGDNGPLSPHAAATLEDHITNNLKTVEELEAFKKRLQERVGVDGQGKMHTYEVQGKDHAAALIKKADAKIAALRAKQTNLNNVKQSLNDKITSGKGLDDASVKEITAYIQKCNDPVELDEISSLLNNKNIKASQSKRNLQQLIETKKNKLAAAQIEARVKAEAEAKAKTKTEAEVEAEPTNIENVSPDIALKNKFGATLYQAYERIIDGINNLKTIVDFQRIKTSIETKFASFKEEMQSMLEKLNLKAKSIGLENKLKLITGVDSNPKLKLPEEIAFDNIRISNRVPLGQRHPNASMNEVLLPEQRKVYTDSYNAYRASKDLKITHNANDILTSDNLLHSTTKLDAIIGDGGILENGLIPREFTGVEGAQFSGGGHADTLTPLSTDVWDVQGSTSIRNYFNPDHPHWRNNGETNFMTPNYNDGRGKMPIIVVLNKKAMDSTLVNNSFNVNTSGSNNIMYKNGLMGGLDADHNYPTHRAIPVGAPANSIDRIIIDPKFYGQENINKIITKIKSQGLDIKLFDLNGNELTAKINLNVQSQMSA